MTEQWKIRINSAGKVVCAPDWSWDTAPGLPDYDLITIWKGSGKYHIDSNTYLARPGACLLLTRGQRVVGEMNPADPMTVTYIHFDYLDARGQTRYPKPSLLPGLYRILDQPLFFGELLDQAINAFLTQKDLSVSDAWMKVILLHLLQQDAQPQWAGFELRQARAFKSLCTRISQNPAFPWRIAPLAREFHCTPDHFGRLFLKYTGASPGRFFLHARINAATDLLRSSSHSIARIAELLGYGDIYAFSRQFKKFTGTTPSSRRKKT